MNNDAKLDKCELGGAVEIKVATPDVIVLCDEFEAAHQQIDSAFSGVTATCAESKIRVASITAVDHKDNAVDLDLAAIAEKPPDFDVYDETPEDTCELFHKYFLFQAGTFALTYIADGIEATQVISIDANCRGCLGCYGCDSCASRRPMPNAKKLLGDWLLLGLSVMTLVSLSTIRKS